MRVTKFKLIKITFNCKPLLGDQFFLEINVLDNWPIKVCDILSICGISADNPEADTFSRKFVITALIYFNWICFILAHRYNSLPNLFTGGYRFIAASTASIEPKYKSAAIKCSIYHVLGYCGSNIFGLCEEELPLSILCAEWWDRPTGLNGDWFRIKHPFSSH